MSPVLLVFFGEVYVYTALGLHKYILAESPPPKELTAQTRGINSFCFTGGQRQLHLWHPQPAPHPQALPFHPRCWVLKAKAATESSDHLAHRGRCPRAPALHPQTQDLLQFRISKDTKPTLPALAYKPSAGSCSIPLNVDVQINTLITVKIIPSSPQSIETNGENRLRLSIWCVPHHTGSQEDPYHSEKSKSWFPWSWLWGCGPDAGAGPDYCLAAVSSTGKELTAQKIFSFFRGKELRSVSLFPENFYSQ